jgi:hypothetical protein
VLRSVRGTVTVGMALLSSEGVHVHLLVSTTV